MVQNEALSCIVKALLNPRGAYLILDTPEGGLFTKSKHKVVYSMMVFGSFITLYFAYSTCNFTIQIYEFDTFNFPCN